MADNSIRILGAWGDDNIQTGRGGRSAMRATEDYIVFCLLQHAFSLSTPHLHISLLKKVTDFCGLLGLILQHQQHMRSKPLRELACSRNSEHLMWKLCITV